MMPFIIIFIVIGGCRTREGGGVLNRLVGILVTFIVFIDEFEAHLHDYLPFKKHIDQGHQVADDRQKVDPEGSLGQEKLRFAVAYTAFATFYHDVVRRGCRRARDRTPHNVFSIGGRTLLQ